MKLVVTGATGYIGSRLCGIASRFGHTVIAASRRRPNNRSYLWAPFDFSSDTTIGLLGDADAIFHLAANTLNLTNEDAEHEVRMASLLIGEARRSSAKFVYVSSQTARSNAPTLYGRTKWRIEQEVLSAGGWVVRPGQVYGGDERGLFGRVVALVRRVPLLPKFIPTPTVQPIHLDDLIEGLLKIAARDDIPPGVLNLASPEPVSFAHFLSVVATARLRQRRWFIPVPVVFVKMLGIALGPRFRARMGLEQLTSLFDLPKLTTAHDLARLGLTLRALSSGLHPSRNDHRRRLLREGLVFLTYVLKERPKSGLLRRYVHAVEFLRGGISLDLPAFVFLLPASVALLDRGVSSKSSACVNSEFVWRLNAATLLAEATSQGAVRFLGLNKHPSPVVSATLVFRAVTAAITWHILRLCLGLFFPRLRNNEPR